MNGEPDAAPFLSDLLDLPVDTGCAVLARFDVAILDGDGLDGAGLAVRLPQDLATAVPKRRAEFLAGRALARIVQGRLGLPQAEIARAPSRAPLWPTGQIGSITHSAGRAGVWIAEASSGHLGLDFETVPRQSGLLAIRDTVLTREEGAVVGDDPTRLCAAFSAKESLFKALHPRVQRFFGFDAAQVVALDDSSVTLRLTRDLDPVAKAGRIFAVRYLCLRGGVCTMIAVA